jgi:hypothetical protein
MYLIFTVTIILFIILFYFFDLEVNITIISCGIIILLLNSLFYKRTYEKFNINDINDINKLHEIYDTNFTEIKAKYKELTQPKQPKYKMIPIYSSNFNDNIFDSIYSNVDLKCKGILFNGEYLSGSDFTVLLNTLTKLT